jgi:hypothetical protein
MSIKTRIRVKNDGELLTWWQEWLKALDAEMATDDGHEAERRHERVEVIQRTIAHTPSEGLLGIAIKLALTSYLEGLPMAATGMSAGPPISIH